MKTSSFFSLGSGKQHETILLSILFRLLPYLLDSSEKSNNKLKSLFLSENAQKTKI